MGAIAVDLFSDTVTRPTAGDAAGHGRGRGGRRAEPRGSDGQPPPGRWSPSCWARRRRSSCHRARCATRSPSRCTAGPGDEILLHETAHPLLYEAGGPAALVGAVMRPLPGARGMYSADQVRQAVRPPVHYMPRTRVLSIEQTANIVGGVCWPLAQIEEVCAAGHAAGLACHMDGARLMNAVVASGTPASAFARPFDSVWIDLTKGLGAPVGAVLAGSQAFIEEGWVFKQRFGGAMRQAGHHRRRGHLRAGAPRGPPGRGPRARPQPGARAGRAAGDRGGCGPGRDEHRDLRRPRHRHHRRGIRPADAERFGVRFTRAGPDAGPRGDAPRRAGRRRGAGPERARAALRG